MNKSFFVWTKSFLLISLSEGSSVLAIAVSDNSYDWIVITNFLMVFVNASLLFNVVQISIFIIFFSYLGPVSHLARKEFFSKERL